ncbi:MAG: HlyD family secretion protein [Xanthobacteraceae bacterium]
MTLQAELDRDEQSVLDYSEMRSQRSWSRSPAGNAALSADAGTAFVRARMPAPQMPPTEKRRIEDSPPLQRDDRRQDQERREASGGRRATRLGRRQLAVLLALPLFAVTALGGYLYWDHSRRFQSTDDAFIAARNFSMAPKVSGYITAVPVTDNQHVAAGDVIARVDDRDYRVALDQAKAQLTRDQALLQQAKTNLGRYQYLVQRSAIAQQQADDQGFLVAQDESTVAIDQAKVDAAQLDLSHTTISAAEPGRVVSLTAAVGQFAQAGTALTMFVPDGLWVTANFKETQLDAMRPGQTVTLAIDAYPDRAIRGHIASVQPGSGTAFSLLPAQNATGNYVKIVQRVPVKIVIDAPPADVALGPGMSVVPTVRIDPTPSLYERLAAWL